MKYFVAILPVFVGVLAIGYLVVVFLDNGLPPIHRFGAHGEVVITTSHVGFEDSTTLMTGWIELDDDNRNVVILTTWHTGTGQAVSRIAMDNVPDQAALTAMAYSSGRTLVALGFGNGTVLVCDAETGTHHAVFHGVTVLGPSSDRFSPDPSIVMPGRHSSSVSELFFTADGGRLIIFVDSTIRIWNISDRRIDTLVQHPGEHVPESLSPLTISRNAKHVVWGEQGSSATDAFPFGGIRIQNTETPEKVVDIAGDRDRALIAASAALPVFSPSGSVVAVRTSDRLRDIFPSMPQGVALYDVDTGSEITSIPVHRHSITCMAFSPDGNRLATGSLDRKIRVWDANSGELLFTLTGHTTGPDNLTFSPDGDLVAAAEFSGQCLLWNISD